MKGIKSFENVERKFKALASGHRIKILKFLEKGDKPLQEIYEHMTPLAPRTVNVHLSKLYEYGVINKHRASNHTFFFNKDDKVIKIMNIMIAN